ncbi:iron complex transport system permease protein [Sinosporangium album]|uniref:Iron complex transport system permease protein n=1 Tax=Sinosporangium album TaxID=504805 RepID=A0A1G8HMF6_9ACTN|nr:iron chelate uptake ABC transporter family permease subunit [Sinosporangium album]SDI07794.1 iron complex transport system permease protein [Sinosporangium album]
MNTALAPRPTGPAHPARRTARARLAARRRLRVLAVGAALTAALTAATIYAIGTGEFDIAPADVIATLLADGSKAHEFIIETLRLPRVFTALLVGAALGMAGAVFQSLTRNPLGSPDIVGFTTGAGTGALIQILVIGGGMAAVATGALLGGLLTSLAVYLLAYRGGVQGYRLVLVGIGVNGGLVATNAYLVARAEFAESQVAVTWLAGNLNGRTWEHVNLLALTLAALIPLTLALGRRLTLLELGDHVATGLGIRVERARLTLILTGVALAAMATVAAGPVPFVALAAPQLARRLTRAPGPGLVPAALMGALLLLLGDLLAQRLLAPTLLPVGVMTGTLGGLYLAWLLVHEWRTTRR